jgi:hypothetical protein
MLKYSIIVWNYLFFGLKMRLLFNDLFRIRFRIRIRIRNVYSGSDPDPAKSYGSGSGSATLHAYQYIDHPILPVSLVRAGFDQWFTNRIRFWAAFKKLIDGTKVSFGVRRPVFGRGFQKLRILQHWFNVLRFPRIFSDASILPFCSRLLSIQSGPFLLHICDIITWSVIKQLTFLRRWSIGTATNPAQLWIRIHIFKQCWESFLVLK